MRLAATIDMYGGGPGSGCEGPNCGRKPHEAEYSTSNIAQTPEKFPSTPYMRLSLTSPHEAPILFRNDGKWSWTDDGKNLHIEVSHQTRGFGYTMKEVFDVPKENIKEWTPALTQAKDRMPRHWLEASRVLRQFAVRRRPR